MKGERANDSECVEGERVRQASENERKVSLEAGGLKHEVRLRRCYGVEAEI